MKYLKKYNERYNFANQLNLNEEDLKVLDKIEELYDRNRQDILDYIVDICDTTHDYKIYGCFFRERDYYREVNLLTSFNEEFKYKFFHKLKVHYSTTDLFYMQNRVLTRNWEYMIKADILHHKPIISDIGYWYNPDSGKFLLNWVYDQDKIDILFEADERLKSIGWEMCFYNRSGDAFFSDPKTINSNLIFFRKIKNMSMMDEIVSKPHRHTKK